MRIKEEGLFTISMLAIMDKSITEEAAMAISPVTVTSIVRDVIMQSQDMLSLEYLVTLSFFLNRKSFLELSTFITLPPNFEAGYKKFKNIVGAFLNLKFISFLCNSVVK